MSQRRCHRCGSALYSEDEGALVYCWHCGAPQVTLSEDLQEQAEQMQRSREDAQLQGNTASSTPLPGTVDWKRAITLCAAVAGTMSLLVILLPPLALLSWVWAPMTPAIVLKLYTARDRQARFSGSVGARVGAVCGLFTIAGLALVNALELDVIRFLLHHTENFDTNFNAMMVQLRAQATAQSGQAALSVLNLLNIPEFRAGFFLFSLTLMSGVILLLAVAGGAFSGAMRARRRIA